jgi:hypothetical protein
MFKVHLCLDMSQKQFLIEYEIEHNKRKRHGDRSLNGDNANDSTTQYTASSSLMSGALKKKTLLSPILRSPSKDEPEHYEWQASRQIRDLKTSANESSARLHDMIGKFTSPPGSPSQSKIRSPPKKRQISPYLQSSRPQSAADYDPHPAPTVLKSTESFARVLNGMTKDIEKMRKHEFPNVSNPSWNDRFVFAGALSPVERPVTAQVHLHHKKFVQKMAQYKTSSKNNNNNNNKSSRPMILSASAPNGLPIAKPRPATSPAKRTGGGEDSFDSKDDLNSHRKRDSSTSPVKFRGDDKSSLRSITPDYYYLGGEEEEEDLEPEKPVDPRLLKAVEMVWYQLIRALHHCGESILYPEIREVAILRDPSDSLISVIGYIALLMGLKPVWKTIKTTLLKESNIFQNFVREVSNEDRSIIRFYLFF